ncbi:MAG: SPASM domain-containing protein [archaeon]
MTEKDVELELPGFSETLKRHWSVMKRHIAPSKLLNLSKALASYKIGMDKVYSLPSIIKFESSIACHLKCYECVGEETRSNLNGKTPFMDLDLYTEIMEENGSTLLEANLYDEGEPMTSPHIVEMVRIASMKNVGTVISTHASFKPGGNISNKYFNIIDEGLDKIIFAIDGVTQETHGTYRQKGNIEFSLANLKKVADYVHKQGLSTIIEWQMIQFWETVNGQWSRNVKEIEEAKIIANDLDIDICIMPNRFTNNQDKNYERQTRCILPYITCSIDFEGNVGACLAYDSPGLEMGQISPSQSLKDIWNSVLFTEMRKEHFKPENKLLNPEINCYSCDRFGG